MDLDHFILVMFIHVIKGKIEYEEVFFVILIYLQPFETFERKIKYFIFSPLLLLISHILPFLHDSSLDSKLSTGHTFSDICMTLRHETMTWHDGVMRHARVAGSCHGLRDSIVTLRDWAVTSAVSATAPLLCSYHCLQYWSLLNMMKTVLKVMDWFNHLPLCSGLVSGTDIRCWVRYGYGHRVMWPAIMRPV